MEKNLSRKVCFIFWYLDDEEIGYRKLPKAELRNIEHNKI